MVKRLDEILQECTARIEIPNSRGHGTGFFISPKTLITCGHVVENTKKVIIYPFNSEKCINAEVKYRFREDIDLAVIEVKSYIEATYSCVYIGHEIEPRDHCFTFGYTENQSKDFLMEILSLWNVKVWLKVWLLDSIKLLN